ncbi:MAG TPA: DUF308 domain-containing protein [Candidatus Egerieicola faecale]|uniref:DUF308 domain-containing protein n=1 Tax=Candidatus Egerieicola faecale TaxID=2840774 RepID=A0A9D1IT82_9FIRM|nr:DUF308 domain-containing protein [Candidatus Egerieicola faecale]
MAEKTKKQGAKRSAQVEFWAYTVLYFVLGLLFLIFNQQLTLIICYILGAALLLGGVVQVVSFLVNRAETTLADRFALCLGVLIGIGGGVILAMPGLLSGVINWLFGIVLIVDGIIKLKTALEAKQSSTGWWLSLIFALAAFLLGVVLMFMPVEQSVLTIFTGIFLMVVAVLNGVSYVYIRRTVKKVEQAITEVQFPQN